MTAFILAAVLAWREIRHARLVRVLIAQRREAVENCRAVSLISERIPEDAA